MRIKVVALMSVAAVVLGLTFTGPALAWTRRDPIRLGHSWFLGGRGAGWELTVTGEARMRLHPRKGWVRVQVPLAARNRNGYREGLLPSGGAGDRLAVVLQRGRNAYPVWRYAYRPKCSVPRNLALRLVAPRRTARGNICFLVRRRHFDQRLKMWATSTARPRAKRWFQVLK